VHGTQKGEILRCSGYVAPRVSALQISIGFYEYTPCATLYYTLMSSPSTLSAPGFAPIDYSSITIKGVHTDAGYRDCNDAYISYARYEDGEKLTFNELVELNGFGMLVWNLAFRCSWSDERKQGRCVAKGEVCS
jgi:hypothetical protein